MKKRVQNTKFELNDDFEIIFLFNAVKVYYPINTKYWTISFDNKILIIGTLLAKFSNLGNIKVRFIPVNVNI